MYDAVHVFISCPSNILFPYPAPPSPLLLQVASIDQLALHFALDSNLLHTESDEAQRQLARDGGGESSEDEDQDDEEGEGEREGEGEGEEGGGEKSEVNMKTFCAQLLPFNQHFAAMYMNIHTCQFRSRYMIYT